jgi:hypothetical protein
MTGKVYRHQRKVDKKEEAKSPEKAPISHPQLRHIFLCKKMGFWDD